MQKTTMLSVKVKAVNTLVRKGKVKRFPKRLPVGSMAEMSSAEERKRFEHMGRITPADLADVDLDQLSLKLQG